MSIIEVWSGVRQWWRRGQFERDMDEEMRFHLDMESRDLVRQGLSENDARTRALATFGGRDRFKEESRHGLPLMWLSDLRADMRYARRSLRRTPVFTAVAVLALGIGIGVSGALFGIADFTAFRPLPVHDPARLVAIYQHHRDGPFHNLSYPTYEMVRRAVPAFVDVAAFTERMVVVDPGGAAQAAWATHTSANYFTVLGVAPQLGHLFQAGDLHRPVAVVSDDFWRRELGGTPDVVGKAVRVNGTAFTVIGVVPRGFSGTRLLTYAPAVWLPIGMHPRTLPASGDLLHDSRQTRFNIVARLSEESAASAQLQLDALASRLSRTDQRWSQDAGLQLLSNRSALNPWLASPDRLTTIAVWSLAGGWLVLIVACADVAMLLLARTTIRRREIATRLAVGASRPRLVRQFVAESLLLGALGTVCGVVVAGLALRATHALTPPLDFGVAFSLGLNGRIVLSLAAAAIVAVLLFGLIPSAYAIARESARVRGWISASVRRPATDRLRPALVIGQVALSLVVLILAGLLRRSADAARRIDVGFETERAAVFTVDPALLAGFGAADVATLYRKIEDEVANLTGVVSVARASSLPLDGNTASARVVRDGAAKHRYATSTDYFVVSPEYFGTLGIALVAGRAFTRADSNGIEPVVVNEVLARRLSPNAPMRPGDRFWLDSIGGTSLEVTGIARSVVSRRVGDAPRPLLWRSLERVPIRRTTVIARTDRRTAEVLPRVRDVMHSLAPDLPVVGLRTMRDQIALAYSAIEGGAIAGSLLGVLASGLAGAGIFGIVFYAVAQRRREMNIRMAMGARPAQLVALVLRAGMGPAIVGIGVGIAAALLIPREMSAMLYGVSTRDPFALTAASMLLFVVVIFATVVPARLGMRFDPRRTLQVD